MSNEKTKIEVSITREAYNLLKVLSKLVRRDPSEVASNILEHSVTSLSIFFYRLVSALASTLGTTPSSLLNSLLSESEDSETDLLTELRERTCVSVSEVVVKYGKEKLDELLKAGKVVKKGRLVCLASQQDADREHNDHDAKPKHS